MSQWRAEPLDVFGTTVSVVRSHLRRLLSSVIDEWLLGHPDEDMRSRLMSLPERQYRITSIVFCAQYAQKDDHQRLGSEGGTDSIMD